MKGDIVLKKDGKNEQKKDDRKDIKERKKASRLGPPDSLCRIVTVQTNESSMSVTRDEKYALDFYCQPDGQKRRKQK